MARFLFRRRLGYFVTETNLALSYARELLVDATVGPAQCRGCWHKGRLYGMPACFHPEHANDCMSMFYSLPYDRRGVYFLERPRLSYRLRHPLSWRKARLAAMHLVPPFERLSEIATPAAGAGYATPPQVPILHPPMVEEPK
jgi:hypothetical protein